MNNRSIAFWEKKSLAELSRAEWESLCDGCGKCCLHRLEDSETGVLHVTNVACRLLDLDNCRCTRYQERSRIVAECVTFTPRKLRTLALPVTCAYRRLAEGKALPAWHPLITGDPASTHTSGQSVLGRVVSECDVDDLEQHLLGVDGF